MVTLTCYQTNEYTDPRTAPTLINNLFDLCAVSELVQAVRSACIYIAIVCVCISESLWNDHWELKKLAVFVVLSQEEPQLSSPIIDYQM